MLADVKYAPVKQISGANATRQGDENDGEKTKPIDNESRKPKAGEIRRRAESEKECGGNVPHR